MSGPDDAAAVPGRSDIRGAVRANTPWIWIHPVAGDPAEFVLDSGFDDDLAANASHLRARGWQLREMGVRPLRLADGSSISYRLFASTTTWLGGTQDVTIADKPTGDALLGYGLLRGTRVRFGSHAGEIERDPS